MCPKGKDKTEENLHPGHEDLDKVLACQQASLERTTVYRSSKYDKFKVFPELFTNTDSN